MSERGGELAARGASLATTEPVAAATGQAVAGTRRTAQEVLGLLVGLLVWLPLGVIAHFGEIVPIIGPWIGLHPSCRAGGFFPTEATTQLPVLGHCDG